LVGASLKIDLIDIWMKIEHLLDVFSALLTRGSPRRLGMSIWRTVTGSGASFEGKRKKKVGEKGFGREKKEKRDEAEVGIKRSIAQYQIYTMRQPSTE
jgi:hypothetical protein